MSNKMSDKMSDNFICTQCNFNCRYSSNYNQHLNTAKHKLLTNADKKVCHGDSYICKCGKKYKHRQSFYRHKTSCVSNKNVNTMTTNKNEINDSVNSKESLILTLLAQNKDLMSLLASQQQQHGEDVKEYKEETKYLVETIQEQSATIQEQSATIQKTIKDIIPKIGNNNTNNTTNNNNKFNLQVFLNEDCKDAINFSEFIENIKVTTEDLENQSQIGYVEGISKLFLENIKELGVNKRPIHCTDKKRNTLYIKENDEWDKEGSQDQLLHGIKVVTGRAHQRLCDMKEENPEEYSDMDSDFSNKCMNIQRSLLPGFPRETTFGKVVDSISSGSIVDREPTLK
jgi:hypothetical protein